MMAQSISGDDDVARPQTAASSAPTTDPLVRLLVASNALLAADAKHVLSVLEHSTPNSWREPFARALLVERAHLMALRSKVLDVQGANAVAKADVLECLEANASALQEIATSVTAGSSKAVAQHAQAAAAALAIATKTSAAALNRLE